MDLFCSFVRVNLFAHKASQLQVYFPLVFQFHWSKSLSTIHVGNQRYFVDMLSFDFADNGFMTVAKENDASDL